jgi:hypothetical protein
VFDFVVPAQKRDMSFFEGIYDWQPVIEEPWLPYSVMEIQLFTGGMNHFVS